MPYALLAIALVALDQLSKYLTVEYIALGEAIPFIPYLIQLTYVKNTGAAFSFFNQHTWILTLISLIMSLVLIYFIFIKPYFKFWAGRLSLTLILAGAVGNLIDRATLGYVVDMIEPIFMNFAVFNVADMCVCVGGFFACVYYLFFYEKLENFENLELNQEINEEKNQ